MTAPSIEVTIFCPVCAVPHVDEGEWATTRQHKTHQCQGCGHEWRPFPFATVGIPHPAALKPILPDLLEALRPFADVTGIPEWPDDEKVWLSCDGHSLDFIRLGDFRRLAALSRAETHTGDTK